MTIFSERESLKRPKFYKNAHNVLHSGSNSIKTKLFLDSSHQYLSSDMWFNWFCGGWNFAIVFIMTSLRLHLLLKFAYFVENTISYQPCKFQLSRISGSNFTDGEVSGKHPQWCTGRKSPVHIGLNHRFRYKYDYLLRENVWVKCIWIFLSKPILSQKWKPCL